MDSHWTGSSEMNSSHAPLAGPVEDSTLSKVGALTDGRASDVLIAHAGGLDQA